MKGVAKTFIGIDLSKAFHKVDKIKLLRIFKKKGIGTENLNVIKRLFNDLSLQIKRGKKCETVFHTFRIVPQRDALSLRFLIVYLDEALREINEKVGAKVNQTSYITMRGHDYAKKVIPDGNPNLEYADDLDFICDDHIDTNKLV